MESKFSHRFSEAYDGLLGFGFSREVDGYTLTYYVQRFSNDRLMALLRQRMSDEDMEELSDRLIGLMRKYLSDQEYHTHFLGEEES